MDRKQKTAAVSTLLSLLLTAAKFILAGLSGSLVILADAWHSLSDVGTSALVFFSVSTGKNRSSPPPLPPAAPEPGEGKDVPDWKNITPEKWASLLIGFVVLLAALGVLEQAFFAPAGEIDRPFLYGVFFLVFAGGSMVVSLFEVRVGKKLNSSGLVADGLHSRADMVTSLVAAGTLFAHHLGLRLDRIGAVIVVLFIFSFSFETLVNFWWSLKGRTGWRDRVAIGLLAAGLQPGAGRKALDWLGELFSWRQLPARVRRRIRSALLALPVLGAVILFLSSCLTVIGPAQEGIRERWGRVVNWGDPLPPGLHFHLPPPLERIRKVDSRTIRRLEIGSVADPGAVALLWTRQHGEEVAYLSAENNFFHPYLAIHYRVRDIFQYSYGVRDPEELLENAADRLLTRFFSTRLFIEIVTALREEMEENLRENLQLQVDRLGAGLELVSVNTKDIHPPFEVAESYERVIAAMQEKQARINRALGYSSSAIPEARGWAARTVLEAGAYVTEQKQAAEGEASRFASRTDPIGAFPAVTRPMLHREAVREALDNRPLVLVDPILDGPDLWLRSGHPFLLEDRF